MSRKPAQAVRQCRACGCTDDDCRGCIERTGEPCWWVEESLCSACVAPPQVSWPELAGQLLTARATTDARGRVRLFLGRRHVLADRAGYCWRYRFVAQVVLGRKLRPDEHVHHRNGCLNDDRPANLEIVSAEYHGRLHASGILVAQPNDDGKLVELGVPLGPFFLPRSGAVVGGAAKGAR